MRLPLDVEISHRIFKCNGVIVKIVVFLQQDTMKFYG
jgi:hypothetical protein